MNEDGDHGEVEETRGAWNVDKVLVFREQFFEFLNHVSVSSKEMGKIVLGEHVYRAQHRFLDTLFNGLADDKHDFKYLKSRQLGISTISRALTLFWIGIHEGLRGYMVFDTDPHKEEARLEMLAMIESLPPELDFPRVKRQNRYLLELSNDSLMNFAAAGVRQGKGSGTLGRSSGINFVHASEICSWDNVEGLESFKNALAEDFPNRLYIYESTARGFNQWHEMWQEAKADPAHQVTSFLGWWAKDNQQLHRRHPDFARYGVDPPSDKEIKKIQAVKALYGWDITPEQLAWVRRKMDPAAQAEGDAPIEFEGDALRVQEQPWCVTRETRVGTSLGIVRIEHAIEGEIGTLGRIVKAGPTGTARIWRARTKLGYEFRGTANHPLIGVDGAEIRLDEAEGKRVKLQPPKMSDELCAVRWREGPIDMSVDITPDLARFVGLFMGDGSASNGSGKHGKLTEVSICCDSKDADIVAECERLLKAVFGVEATVNRSRPGWSTVRTGTRIAFDTVKKLGLTRNDTVKTMRRVHVPEFIWQSPRHVVKEFLSGLFEADGYNGSDSYRVAFFSKYEEFIQDIQILLLAFGITSRATVHKKKKAGSDRHEYTGNQLELRKAEAIRFNEEIGFLSARKRGRHEAKAYHPRWANREKPAVVLEDEVVSVIDEGVEEEVFNLTIDGSHLFDANGVLTHNTEDEAFQMTGATFFQPENLTEIANNTASKKYKAYSYICGMEFAHSRIVPAHNTRSIELKMWEEAVEEGVYIVAADVAFGSNEKNDRSAAQVLRCYADGIEQVAEYAWPLVNSRQYAWVLASLLGYYGKPAASQVYFILEINGPGEAVWNELQSLKRELQYARGNADLEDRGILDMFKNVRNYLYTRSDSMTTGQSFHFKTTVQLKVAIMERLRDFVTNMLLTVRSLDTVEEMKSITRDGDHIAAQGSKKDDRAVALALGVRCWEERVRRAMMAGRRTRANEEAKRRLTIKDQYQLFNNNMLESFFAIKSSARKRAASAAQRAKWRGR